MKLAKYLSAIIVITVLVLLPELTQAQCAMCQASVESSLREGSNVARGLNTGILYLLVMPYLLFSILFLLWYRGYKHNKAKLQEIIYRRASGE